LYGIVVFLEIDYTCEGAGRAKAPPRGLDIEGERIEGIRDLGFRV
jgi:hypothetical protein